MRHLIGRIYATYFFLRTFGRVRGHSFILRSPSNLRVHRGGSITIGAGTLIDKDARIVVRSRLIIGERVFIGKNCTLVAFADVEIGADTLIAENVSIHSEDHGPAGFRSDFEVSPVSIESDSWLGAGVVVTKGCTVGTGSTIGANAVVTRDVPPRSLAVGIPARVIGPAGTKKQT